MRRNKSLSMPLGDDRYGIALNPRQLETTAEEKSSLAHEVGHCMTGSFYNRYATCDIRQKHENRADKWAIKQLIPQDELEEAVANGYTEIWRLAEFFDVTEDYIRKAISLYKFGNLASTDYI